MSGSTRSASSRLQCLPRDSDHVEPVHAELSRAAALLADQHRPDPRTDSIVFRATSSATPKPRGLLCASSVGRTLCGRRRGRLRLAPGMWSPLVRGRVRKPLWPASPVRSCSDAADAPGCQADERRLRVPCASLPVRVWRPGSPQASAPPLRKSLSKPGTVQPQRSPMAGLPNS